jgi:DNA-binding NtrC family response regulator
MSSLPLLRVQPAKPLHEPLLRRAVRSLVVSSRLEARHSLVEALEALGVDVIVCANRCQAEEVLSKQAFDIVFCDEHLSDGCYSDLVHPNHWEHRIPRLVVTTRCGDWDLYFAALAKGAFDVLRRPGYATDLERIVILALHEEDRTSITQTIPS